MPNLALGTVLTLADRLSLLPRFYSHQDILDCFASEDAFIDAYCDGTLPQAVRKTLLETAGVERLTVWLLTRQVRLLNELVHLAREPVVLPDSAE